MMTICSFEQWQENQLNNTPPDELVVCPECNGETIIYDECDCCGHDTESDCSVCSDNNGKVLWGDLSGSQQASYLSIKRYNDALIGDLAALATWQSRPRLEILIEYGFTAFSMIFNKAEKVVKCDSSTLRHINRQLI